MLLTGEQSPDQDASSHAVYILVKGDRHKKKKSTEMNSICLDSSKCSVGDGTVQVPSRKVSLKT